MSPSTTCPRCATHYDPASSPDGLCPTCLAVRAREALAPPPEAAEQRVPTAAELAPHFPQLVIGEELGRGGMGVVYRARQIELDRPVALKVLTSDAAAEPAFAERFRREARALASLSHPGIVDVYDFGCAGRWHWLVMELVDGASLRRLLDSGPIEPARALVIVRQTCAALEFAHARGVVHRDIKPENVLVDREGTVKLVDFGLARLVGGARHGVTLTRTGQAMGTPHYMAPEQWREPDAVDHRADIYSLGVVLYELLTHELPLGRFEPPSRKVRVDVRLDEIVLKAMETEPERRYQHTSEVRTDLESLGEAPTPPEAEHALAREVRGPGALVWRAGWVLGISIAILAASWAWRAIVLTDLDGSVAERELLIDTVSTCVAIVGLSLGLVALSRSRLHARERALGVTHPRPAHERPWLLPSLVLIACAELLYAANATPNEALTETAWRATPFQALTCVFVWMSARLSRPRRSR